VRKLLISTFFLAVVLVGADIAGRAIAQHQVGLAVAAKSGGVAPSVRIHGFSFLLEAITGHYPWITVASPDVSVGPITNIVATIELTDVSLPFSEAVHGDTSHLTAARATVRGEILASRVAAALDQPGVTLSEGSAGSIRVSTTITVLGQAIPITADLLASYREGSLHLDARNLSTAGVARPATGDLTKRLSLKLPLAALPFPINAATLTASGEYLALTATAENVQISSIS